MTDWNKIDCRKCGRCNKKGKPSVMKGSLKCEKTRGIIAPERLDICEKIQDLLPFKHINIKEWFKKKKEAEKEEIESKSNNCTSKS